MTDTSERCTCCSDTMKKLPVIKPKLKTIVPVINGNKIRAKIRTKQLPIKLQTPTAEQKRDRVKMSLGFLIPETTGKAIPKHGAGGRSFNGIPFSFLKSAIQKYIRRGDKRAVHYAIDYSMICMFLYSEYSGDFRIGSIKGSLTNILNRLRVIAIEDVGLGSPEAPSVVESLIGPVDRYKDSVPKSDTVDLAVEKIIRPIIRATDYLRKCPKIRAISYLKTAFTLPPYYDTYEVQSKKLEQLSSNYPNLITSAGVDAPLDLGEGISFFAALSRYLAKHISRDAINHVWKILEKSPNWSRYSETLKILKRFSEQGYKTGNAYNEKIIAMYQAALLVLLEPNQTPIPDDDDKLLKQIYNDVINMRLPEYEPELVEDRHTNRGGSLIQFSYIGAYVNNPMLGYLPWRYDQLYNEMKVLSHFHGKYNTHSRIPIIPYKADAIRELTGLRKAQLLTSASKVPTYIGQFHIYKGPYTQKQFSDAKSRFNHSIHYTEMLQDMEDYLELRGYMRTTLPIRYIAKVEDDKDLNGYYLVWDNIGDYSSLQIEDRSSKINELGPVMVKGSMVQNLNDAKLTKNHKIAAVQHLYLRYVSGLGDSGPWNILERHNETNNLWGQIVVGVDLEDMRGKITSMDTPIHLLMNRPSDKYQTIYGPYVSDIVQLPDTDKWGQDVQTRIRTFSSL